MTNPRVFFDLTIGGDPGSTFIFIDFSSRLHPVLTLSTSSHYRRLKILHHIVTYHFLAGRIVFELYKDVVPKTAEVPCFISLSLLPHLRRFFSFFLIII